jgi:hypothetical protein
MSYLYHVDSLEPWDSYSAWEESEPCKPFADLIDRVVAPEMKAEGEMVVSAIVMSA